jgi:plasmid stabilization system protein ParE
MVKMRMMPSALRELEGALRWYAGQSAKAESMFANAVDSTLRIVERTPLLYAKSAGRYRLAQVPNFPYVLAYRIDGDHVTIASVRHTSRDDADSGAEE